MLTNWKKFFLRTTQPEPPKQLETATAWLGQLSQGGRIEFSERVGYSGVTWAGAFIDCVFHDAGLIIPSVTYPASGLAEFIKTRRVVEKPQPGDIVFFNFATDEAFGMPHVGLVTNTEAWRPDGYIQTIEANVNSGLPKASLVKDGVYRRVRSKREVLGFGRPGYKPMSLPLTGVPEISIGNIRPGKRNREIELVQRALAQRVGLGAWKPGMYDGHVMSAYAQYQRIIGFVGDDANGIPDIDSLQRLGKETGTFTAVAS